MAKRSIPPPRKTGQPRFAGSIPGKKKTYRHKEGAFFCLSSVMQHSHASVSSETHTQHTHNTQTHTVSAITANELQIFFVIKNPRPLVILPDKNHEHVVGLQDNSLHQRCHSETPAIHATTDPVT
jgi:hypothetical protein